MNDAYKYQYNPETKILHKIHLGKFGIEDIIKAWDRAINEDEIPNDTKGFLVDFTDAELCFQMGDEKIMIKYFNEREKYFKDTVMAVVVNTPHEIIFPMMVENRPKTFNLKAFSTLSAARAWLLSTVE